MRRRTTVVLLGLVCGLLVLFTVSHTGIAPTIPPPAPPAAANTPLIFEPNIGQVAAPVQYLARVPGGTVFFAADQVAFVAASARARDVPGRAPLAAPPPPPVVRVQFVGADPAGPLTAAAPQPGRINYFRGTDPAGWRTGVVTYGTLTYPALYPGIRLDYAGSRTDGRLKSVYTIAAGAEADRIRWRYRGATVAVDGAGNLQIQARDRRLTEQAPVAWQEGTGRRVGVAVAYALAADGSVGFALGAYDPKQPLIIDPSLIWSTYLGGTGEDTGYGIAVDAAGNTYVSGYTDSTNFPTANPYQPLPAGDDDAFITKFSAGGNTLIWSTYLGGSGEDSAGRLKVDAAGNVYVVGYTDSTNFPVTGGAYQPTYGGGPDDVFVTKLAPNGQSLLFSTYLGGTGTDLAHGIVLDSSGRPVVAGETDSANFPTLAGYQMTYQGGPRDGFVTKFNPAASSLVWSTYLGGTAEDHANGLAIDNQDALYLAGQTSSLNYPTANAFQPAHGGGTYDGVVTKLNPAGNGLGYSTYLGGNGGENLYSIAVDGAGSAVAVGYTDSGNYPLHNPQQPSYGGGVFDTVVTKFSNNGTTLLWSTFLGGAGYESAADVTTDGLNGVWVVGVTDSPNFPQVAPIQPYPGAGFNGFLTRYTADGQQLVTSTNIGGGGGDETVRGVAVDAADNAYLTGDTGSSDFPVRGAYQPIYGGGVADAFVLKVSPLSPTPTQTGTATPNVGATQTSVAATQTALAGGTATSVAATATAVAGATQTSVAATATAGAGATATSIAATATAGAGATATSVAATATAGAGATQTAAAATQTASAGGTATSVAATATAGATQTAISATQTAIAQASFTATPTPNGATQTAVAQTQTAVAQTQTAVAQTQTAVAGTQTAVAGTATAAAATQTTLALTPSATPNGATQTAVAATQTSVAATQTSVAATQTALAYTATPTAMPTACLVQFADNPPAAPFYAYIRCLVCRGIVNGYSCGGAGEPCLTPTPPGPAYYRPGSNVTRGQLSKIIANSAGLAEVIPSTQQTFEDVPAGQPFWLWIERLAGRGHINGYNCGQAPTEPCVPPLNRPYFRPGNNATRGQISKIVANAAGFGDPVPSTQQTFEDVPATQPFWVYIERIAERGVISGYDCGQAQNEPCVPPLNRNYFRPGNPTTRGQMAKIDSITFFPGCNPPARR